MCAKLFPRVPHLHQDLLPHELRVRGGGGRSGGGDGGGSGSRLPAAAAATAAAQEEEEEEEEAADSHPLTKQRPSHTMKIRDSSIL